jgi:hypothetical protein
MRKLKDRVGPAIEPLASQFERFSEGVNELGVEVIKG